MATMAEASFENVDPNMAAATNPSGGLTKHGKKPPKGSSSSSTRRRRSSIGLGKNGRHFQNDSEDDDDDEVNADTKSISISNKGKAAAEEDITWTLNGADSSDEEGTTQQTKRPQPLSTINQLSPMRKKKGSASKPRRRRRSSARFLLTPTRKAANENDNVTGAEGTGINVDRDDDDEEDANSPENNYTSSEHLGEIYKQAIRMNAENKINAGNSWGLRLIENMDKFIEEDGGGDNGGKSPRDNATASFGTSSSRRNKLTDEKGRVNFTKASCTLDASVKIYSYRVDDVHLSSYRVLANLNRTDNKKDNHEDGEDGFDDGDEDGGGGTQKAARRRNADRKGNMVTIESNLANINMSKLDSAYDIDPLFHKMSKSFDEGGAKGLLLGNLGVSSKGCHIVFDSKEELEAEAENKLEGISEVEETEEGMDVDNEEEKQDERVVWKEMEIDISGLSAKLDSMILAYGVKSSDSVPFVPQLESLRNDYAILEENGFAVDEKDACQKEGRRRSKLYDAPEEEEKEAEKSIHHIALERSRGSVLGMSFDTNFRLSLDSDHGEGEFAPEGEGEFAPDYGNDEFGGDEGFTNFMPDEDDAGFSSPSFKRNTDKRTYDNTKVLLDALCDGDAFYDAGEGGNSDFAFFDMSKLEKVTNGNLWAGSQHWKKVPGIAKNNKADMEKKKVSFGEGNEEKTEKKKSAKKDRVFVDFTEAPDVKSIFDKKKTTKRTKKTPDDPFQLPKRKVEVDYLLPPDANVDITQLTRLFSRPNAIVRRGASGMNKPIGKTVGFYDVEDNALGFDDANSFGNGNDGGGFEFAYDGEDNAQDDADYRLDDFDEVRKVEKIDITYATVAKKVDVRRLKKDLWAELEAKTLIVPPEDFLEKTDADTDATQDDIYADPPESNIVSFKETIEKIDMAQSQHDVTVSYYFICCLHLANEKGLKFDSTGLEDFMISVDDGSAPTFGTFGQDVLEKSDKLGAVATSRSKRERKEATNYADEDDGDELSADNDDEE